MRISDWSSDVCSSDLPDSRHAERQIAIGVVARRKQRHDTVVDEGDEQPGEIDGDADRRGDQHAGQEIGPEPPRQAEAHAPHRPRRRRISRLPDIPALAHHANPAVDDNLDLPFFRSEAHTSELQSLMRISSAVFCLKKKTTIKQRTTYN